MGGMGGTERYLIRGVRQSTERHFIELGLGDSPVPKLFWLQKRILGTHWENFKSLSLLESNFELSLLTSWLKNYIKDECRGHIKEVTRIFFEKKAVPLRLPLDLPIL